jgi:carbon monoxide dehydrogenase subunit G
MQLEHSFTVPVGVDRAWMTLLDIEQVAPCMPGAALDSVDGDDFTGTVKVKLGPIGLTYKGKASFLDKDEAAHKAIIGAQGKDSRGNGTAAATVTATLTEVGEETRVHVVTDLNITGKPAQFGRGVMVDVGNKLIGQFADCLAGKLAASDEPSHATGAAAAQPADEAVGGVPATSGPVPAPRPEPEPINLMASAGPALAKRLTPVVAGVAALVALVLVLRRRRG